MNKEEMNKTKILRSGVLEQIVTLPEEVILEHFGAESFEYLAFERREADKIWRERDQKYILPTRTESPTATRPMLYDWIKDFHLLNGMKLPPRLSRRNKLQLLGMYNGMKRTYDLKEKDIVIKTK